MVMKSTILWDITPYSPLSVNHLLSRWFLARLIFLTQKMEAICFSEMSVDTQRTTRRYIPEDGTLHLTYCSLFCIIWARLHKLHFFRYNLKVSRRYLVILTHKALHTETIIIIMNCPRYLSYYYA
jgi:hypothetical protein